MVAYYMFHKQKMLPSEYLAMNRLDKAMVIAFIQEKIEQEKEAEKLNQKNKPKGKGRKR